LKNILRKLSKGNHPRPPLFNFLKFMEPRLIDTVGFIDPGK
jgi:hypothetical protein